MNVPHCRARHAVPFGRLANRTLPDSPMLERKKVCRRPSRNAAQEKHSLHAGVNIGNGKPSCDVLKTSFTFCPTSSASKSQSTIFVSMAGPSSNLT